MNYYVHIKRERFEKIFRGDKNRHFFRRMKGVSCTALRRAASRSILNKTLLQVSLMVLYNALVPNRVDDCIRVLVLHEQAAQSASVPDIDLRRKKSSRGRARF